MYKITDYSYKQAKKLGVEIKPSNKKNKKIDVINNGNVISIGDKRYLDYPSYLKINKELANKHRNAYKKRHNKYRNIRGTASYFADKILW